MVWSTISRHKSVFALIYIDNSRWESFLCKKVRKMICAFIWSIELLYILFVRVNQYPKMPQLLQVLMYQPFRSKICPRKSVWSHILYIFETICMIHWHTSDDRNILEFVIRWWRNSRVGIIIYYHIMVQTMFSHFHINIFVTWT